MLGLLQCGCVAMVSGQEPISRLVPCNINNHTACGWFCSYMATIQYCLILDDYGEKNLFVFPFNKVTEILNTHNVSEVTSLRKPSLTAPCPQRGWLSTHHSASLIMPLCTIVQWPMNLTDSLIRLQTSKGWSPCMRLCYSQYLAQNR